MKLICMLVALTLAAPPSVSEPGNPLQIEDAKALSHFTSGMEAWLAEDYAVAQRELEAAFRIEPKPSLLYSLGQLARLRGDCALARERFEAYLETDPPAEAAEDTRLNIERCEPRVPAPVPSPEITYDPPVDRPAPPPSQPGPDALGVALTAVGSAVTIAGVSLFGAAFAERRRADDEFGVADFERRIDRAQAEYWAGVGLAAVGVSLLAGGITRLVLIRRRRARSPAATIGARHIAGSRYSW